MSADRHWLTRERLHLYPWVLVAFYLLMLVLVFKPVSDGSAADGSYVGQGMDFSAFWTASRFALQGQPERAYDLQAMSAAQRAINPQVELANQWSYPPAFLLICLPLALLPFLPSFALFIGASFAAYAAALRRIAPPDTGMVLLLGFPGVFQNLIHGQNGFLTASLMGAGLLWLPTRPILAGVAFGLLTIKPHLGLLIPLALVCSRQWRTIASAALTAVLLHGISLQVFGLEVFGAFLDRIGLASEWLVTGLVPFRKNPSFFSFAMLLGQPVALAWALQVGVAVVVTGLVAGVWLRGADHALRAASLMTGSLLMTPYLLEYDLSWLAFPIAWCVADGRRHGWRPGEREWLALSWLIPLGVGWLVDLIQIQIAPLVIFGLLLLIVRRALSPEPAGQMPAAPEARCAGGRAMNADPHWMTATRLRQISMLAVAIYGMAFAHWLWQWQSGEYAYFPAALDFIAYWTAAGMAVAGHAAAAYDLDVFVAAQHLAVPEVQAMLTWQYPPTFHLLLMPLALLPYLGSYLLFTISTLAAYLAVAVRIVPAGTSLFLLLAMPGVFRNASFGQNGFLTAALIGAGLLLLPARPLLAGLAFGLLSIKPQLALLVPVALICARQWQALMMAAVTALGLLGLSQLVLGSDTLPAFVGSLANSARWLAEGRHPTHWMPTAFALARGLGASIAQAQLVQALLALLVAMLVGQVWRVCRSEDLRAAALTAGSLLISPYLYDYDLVWLGLPIAWFAKAAMQTGWRLLDREALLLVAMLPMFVIPLNSLVGVQPAVLVLFGFFLMIVRRALASPPAIPGLQPV